MKSVIAAGAALIVWGGAFAAPVTYVVDPTHTYPSFAADHYGGMSVMRGKFIKNSGTIVLDRAAKTGTVEITIDTSAIDFGDPKLDDMVKNNPNFLDVAHFATAVYKGTFSKFNEDAPTEVQGNLTLHGVTKPVTLQINQFKCRMHPLLKREWCGAEASATINRKDFGVSMGDTLGFEMGVKLFLEVEAVAAPPAEANSPNNS